MKAYDSAVSDAIPFNKPHLTGQELVYIRDALSRGKLSGDGSYTQACHAWLERSVGSPRVLLTPSCTAALEMAALLLDLAPGDEVIMPSYTFVSTANAFVLRGAVPVFVDVRSDTLNIDETKIEAAVTAKTRAIVPVHYAGVACAMDAIDNCAKQHDLWIVEDAAQGLMAQYNGRPLGGIGDFGAYSFHDTKNIGSGEGGCLLVNDKCMASRAEIVREKGTDRSRFLRGEVDKYTWQETGSSYLPSELTAAFLLAQLEAADAITQARLVIWQHYHRLLEPLEARGLLRRPFVPKDCRHNAHMYYIILPPRADRESILAALRQANIQAASHYVPLHSSPAGRRYGKVTAHLAVTEDHAARLLRLPLWVGLTVAQQERVVEVLGKALG